MKSLDLFTGIGGISYALRGIMTPVGYCEIDPAARLVLKELMRRGVLPKAPVHTDVTQLTGTSFKGKIDAIVAGFPCQGFSMAGFRRGFDHTGSGLYSHIERLVQTIRPSVVFLENVASICAMGGLEHVAGGLAQMGYDVSWVTMCAHHVGAPHRRKRWFCLAVLPKTPAVKVKIAETFQRYMWTREPVPRMVHLTPRTAAARMEMLGNAVVPDCVRLAFLYLWSGSPTTPVTDLLDKSKGMVLSAQRPPDTGKESPCAHHGAVRACSSIFRKLHAPRGVPGIEPHMRIVMVPGVYVGSRGKNPYQRNETLKKPAEKPCWATPRRNWCPSATLTKRVIKDLPTQMRFEKNTPEAQRPLSPNCEFLEYLMGYPIGYSSFTFEENVKKEKNKK